MALLNRNLKLQNAEEIPLMKADDGKILQSDIAFKARDDSDDEDVEEKPLKQHDITLWLSDAVVLIVEHFQYYAVLLALSEHWGWPKDWIDSTSFTFIFNFDIWEFRKVETGLFHHSTSTFVDTSKLGFNYTSYIGAWAVILFIIAAGFGGVYFRWMNRRPLYLLLYIARWKRVMFLVFQFLAVPFGVAAARVFHCRKEDDSKTYDVMVVQNEIKCFSAAHIAFMVFVVAIFLFMFLLYPFILIKWVREQVFSGDPKRHEGYLQLKEAEYEQGLDILWEIGQYHLFSSYKRAWIHYNPLKFLFKLLFIAAFAMSVHSAFWASASITMLFCVAVLALICRRPFRVRCFNVMIISSHFLVACNALIGNFMVRPPWENADDFQLVAFLRYPTVLHILMAINITWVAILACWLLYLMLLNRGLIGDQRIWPRLSYTSSNTIGEDTKKYLKAALRARHTLERALSSIPLFAPIHELAHQIKVVNAYCREAEYIGDPTHDTLCDLLDELIEAHNTLSGVSVFGMSGKTSVKETSEEFIRLMPSFRKRLKQREYDFILVPAVKRRLLLKMYILSVFINNKHKKKSPAEDVTTKLQEALAMFDTRSLMSDYDTGIGSSTSVTVSSESRPLSTRAPTNMTSFLNDVDMLVGNYDNNDNENERKASRQSMTFDSRPTTAQTLSPQFRASPNTSHRRFDDSAFGSKAETASRSSSKASFRSADYMQSPTKSLSRPGTAPVEMQPSQKTDLSRPTTAPGSSRSNTPSGSAVFMSKVMSSTASIPGQIDEEEEFKFKQSSTMLQ